MKTIFVMAGTTEGRLLIEQLASLPLSIVVSVTTQYGASLLPMGERLQILVGKLDQCALESLLHEIKADCAVDATHPYAIEASQNLSAACTRLAIPYHRLLRDVCDVDGCTLVDTPQAAAQYLAACEGNVLLTIGSNALDVFAQKSCTERRYYARVLPLPHVLEKCAALGFDGRYVVAMQGPFSVQYNIALLREINARWMVTKESGNVGGFREKQEAAAQAGVELLVIGRPPQEPGLSLPAIVSMLRAQCTGEAIQ